MNNRIKIVHVDDQPRQLKAVAALLAEIPDVVLQAQFTDAIAAKEFLLANETDIVISDIEMPNKNGLWLADQLKSTPSFIVFLTGHSDYLLKAFEVSAMHYILKPVTKKAILEVIDKYNGFYSKIEMVEYRGFQTEQVNEVIERYEKVGSFPNRIFINNLHKTSILNLSDVMYMVSNGPYTNITTVEKTKYVASKPLKVYFDAIGNHPDFSRIHRAHFVNKKFVKSVIRERHKIFAEMADKEKLEISPLKRNEIFEMLS
jgi:two-component system LytT family response regulator